MTKSTLSIGDILLCSFDTYLITKNKGRFSLISMTTKREFPLDKIDKQTIEIEILDKILSIQTV